MFFELITASAQFFSAFPKIGFSGDEKGEAAEINNATNGWQYKQIFVN
jgi:hypothetical protein